MAKRLLMGNEAFAHAALEAGVNVVAGYPGTPSSEVIETVARLHKSGKAEDVYVEWSCNEKAALEVAAAASMSGARALFTCKQVGLNVASDALMSLNYVGVRGGLVIFVADDPGPISSQTEQDTRRFAAFAKVPVLDPATPEQGFQMIKAAFELSEAYRTPVIVRPTTRIDHASTFFEIEPHTVARPLPEGQFQRDPNEWVIFPKRSYRAHGEINQRLNSIAYDFTYDTNFNRFNNGFDKISGMPARPLPDLSTELGGNGSRFDEMYEAGYAGERPKLGIVCGGVSRQYALEAIEIIEREAESVGAIVPSYRFLQIGTPYPFPGRIARRFLKDLSDVLVLEELDSVIEEELLKVSGVSFLSPNIHGKLTKEANDRGENSTEDCAYRIAAFFDKYSKSGLRTLQSSEGQNAPLEILVDKVLGAKALLSYDGELPPRPPVLCAGCPHRGSFYAMKRAIKTLKIAREDAVFCGDIGCYTLGNAMPLDACDTCLCMGAGITMAQGFSATNPLKKSIAFIGDSTFFASGMTGIANAVYNQHDITICILDNSTTAMTGSQPHPGTGATLMGTQSKPIDIEGVLRSLGVNSIVEVNPLDEAAAESACIESLLEEAPTAIIFKSPCVWLRPFGSPAKVHINACTGCKKCITEIGCPAIGFDKHAQGAKSKDRGQAVIDESQCNGCGLCLQVCPFKAIEIITPEEQALFESARRATGAGSAATPGSVTFAGSRGGVGGGRAGAGGRAGGAAGRRRAGGGERVGMDDARAAGVRVGAGAADAAARKSVRSEQAADIGSDRPDVESVNEPREDVADFMLEIEDAFELDGGVMLDAMAGDEQEASVARYIPDNSVAVDPRDILDVEESHRATEPVYDGGALEEDALVASSIDEMPDIEQVILDETVSEAVASDAPVSEIVEKENRYYMKNTSYRRKAFVNLAGAQTGAKGGAGAGTAAGVAAGTQAGVRTDKAPTLTGEIDLTRDEPSADEVRAAQAAKAAADAAQEEDALDVLQALNSSIYFEVDDEEELEDEAASHEAAGNAADKVTGRDDARDAKRGAAAANGGAQVGGKSDRSDKVDVIDGERGATEDIDEAERKHREAEADRAERERMRAKYAQYAHYSPTKYATQDLDLSKATSGSSKDGTQSSGTSQRGSAQGGTGSGNTDKPSVKQSRWGGRG